MPSSSSGVSLGLQIIPASGVASSASSVASPAFSELYSFPVWSDDEDENDVSMTSAAYLADEVPVQPKKLSMLHMFSSKGQSSTVMRVASVHRNELNAGEIARALDAPPHPAGHQEICLRAKGKARVKKLKPNEATIAVVAYGLLQC